MTPEIMTKVVYNLQRDVDEGRVLDYDAEGELSSVLNRSHGLLTHRYAVDGDTYSIQSYKEAVTTSGKGRVGEEPSWLKSILDIARLGEHGLTIIAKPPDYVLWFETDPKMNLVNFVVEAEQLNED